jgi:hypothetical protein
MKLGIYMDREDPDAPVTKGELQDMAASLCIYLAGRETTVVETSPVDSSRGFILDKPDGNVVATWKKWRD